MKTTKLFLSVAAGALTILSSAKGFAAGPSNVGTDKVKHVVLLSIDGMHAVDFFNCSHGIAGANGGEPYCPNLAALAKTGINYVSTSSSKPSDSAPGLMALVTGGTPKTTGIYYDVAFDRTLDGPATTTGTGLGATLCTPFAAPVGTTTDNDQGIDIDDSKLNGGAPGTPLPMAAQRRSTLTNCPATRPRVAQPCIRGTFCEQIRSSA